MFGHQCPNARETLQIAANPTALARRRDPPNPQYSRALSPLRPRPRRSSHARGRWFETSRAHGNGLQNSCIGELARDLALDDKTVKAHAKLLTQLFLLDRLRPWSTNLGARQVKTPKLLLTDTGLAAALVGVDSARYSAPDQGARAGALSEPFVVMELIKQTGWSTTHFEVFFYRDTEKREVDLVLESASGDVVAVEAKSAAAVTATDARGLRPLRDKLGPLFKTGVVVYSGEHTLPIDDRIWALPISGLWQ